MTFSPLPIHFPSFQLHTLQSLVFIDMDNVQTAFVTHYPSYGFDLKMMKVHDGPKTCIAQTRSYSPTRDLWNQLEAQMPKEPAGHPPC